MILTAHYEDGSTQKFNVPDWARWVEYCSDGRVWVWQKKPTKKYLSNGDYRVDQPNRPNKLEYAGLMQEKQQHQHRATLQRIEFTD